MAVAKVISEAYEQFDFEGADPTAPMSPWHDLATLSAVLGELASAMVEDRNRDIVGDVFEHVLGRMSTAGHMGQFRTPRHIIQLIVDLTEPTPADRVLDPACGTGGFLIAAAEYARTHSGDIPELIGEEIDLTICRLARANAQLHGLGSSVVHCQDSLQQPGSDASVILANPPFAGSVVQERVMDFRSGARKTELLFLELMMRRLCHGGRAGVVVPFGVLTATTSAALWLRRRLIHENQLAAVVELPRGVFRPYTDVRTALLFWQSGGETGDVKLIKAFSDGFSLDDRRTPVAEDDLPLVKSIVQGDLEAELFPETCAVVPAEIIAQRNYDLNPSRYIGVTAPEDGAAFVPSEVVAELGAGVVELSKRLEQLEQLV